MDQNQAKSDSTEAIVLKGEFKVEETKLFANAADFEAGRYFVKTKFHDAFIGILELHRLEGNLWTSECGIKGLGYTSSVLYYVWECRKKNDNGIHYIDLNEVEKRDKSLEIFMSYADKFNAGDCLIIDHVTIYNSHYLNKIKAAVEGKLNKVILIETGFTASANTVNRFGREFQLSEECFQKMWNGSLKLLNCQDLELPGKAKEVYEIFSKHYIMTPKLLHTVLKYMFKYSRIGRTVLDALDQYDIDRKKEVVNLMGCDRGANNLYDVFELHTKVLLNIIPNKEEVIITCEQCKQLFIAINIFEKRNCIATKDEAENNIQMLELDISEGSSYVKLRHLVPSLANEWRKKLPYSLEDILKEASSDEILAFVFEKGGARKQFEKLFVENQKKEQLVILPQVMVTETSYQPSKDNIEVPETTNTKLILLSGEKFYMQDSLWDAYLRNNIPEDLKGPEKNVAILARYAKKLMESHDIFVVFPEVQNFIGFDYMVYVNEKKVEYPPPPKMAKGEENRVLYLVQIATGASHKGYTTGKSLNVVKKIFSDENITVHVVVVIVRNDHKPFALTKCRFENITVLNVCSQETESVLRKILPRNNILYKLYSQLLKGKSPSSS